MTDEEWVEMWSASDATFFARFSEEMSLIPILGVMRCTDRRAVSN
jgi:hypothetical protein